MSVAILAAGVAASPAGATNRVGPGQSFTGVVNGRDGTTAVPVVIRMACFGPLRPGETGHPVAGQTLAVHRLSPPATVASPGYTGTDSEIGVFFNAPPPVAPPVAARYSTPVFTHYDRTRPLPTSVVLPCAGTGTVWFTPIPVIPPSRSATVTVQYVGQP